MSQCAASSPGSTHDAVVVGLGQACVDFLARLPFYPEENAKVELSGLQIECGGPACTAIVTLAKFGVPTSFLGSVSDDYLGKRIIENLISYGIDISNLKVTPGHTSQFAFIAISPGGYRTIFWHRGSMPPLAASDIDLSLYPRMRMLHLDGLMIEACIEAARQAKARGVPVMMDAGTMREGSKDLVSLVDILVASETFAEPMIGKGADPREALKALKALGPRHVVITLGEKGSVGMDEAGIYRQPAFPVDAVDTTGAGDVYHGAYIYAMLQGLDMQGCMRFASAAAALKCLHVGAQPGIPSLGEVMKFLEEAPCS